MLYAESGLRFMTKLRIENIDVSRPVAIFLLVVTALLWSMGGLFVKMINWHPLATAGMRSLISALTILFLIRKPKININVPFILGVVSYAAAGILFVSATKLTTAANAILLQYTAPVYVAVLGAVFLKEYVRKSDWLCIAITLAGMTLFFVDKLSAGNLIGNLLAILDGIAFALIAVCLRRESSSAIHMVFWGNVLIAIVGFPFILCTDFDPQSLISVTFMGVFQFGISYVLYTIAIKKVTALEGVLIPVIEPIMNPLIVLAVTGEIPGKWALVGGLVVMASVTVRCIYTILRPVPNQ